MNQINVHDQFVEALFKRKDLLHIISTAVAQTISNYTKTIAAPGDAILKRNADVSEYVIASCVRLEKTGFALELFLKFSEELFLKFYENIFQIPVEGINDETKDLAGELLNIAFGVIDPEFAKHGVKLRSSFPRVFVGAELKNLKNSLPSTTIEIPFTSLGKPFVLQLYPGGTIDQPWQYTK